MFANQASAVTIGNTAALATAIGGAVPQAADVAAAQTLSGARLVDTQPINSSYALNSVGAATGLIDCSNAISFEAQISALVSAAGTVTLLFTWYDATGTVPLTSTVWEISGKISGVGYVTNILDRCLSPLLQISVLSVQGGTFSQVVIALTTSSRPVERPRVVDALGDASGVLLNTGNVSLAAGATDTVTRICGLTTGRILVSMNGSGAGAQFRMRGGFGLLFNAPITLVGPVFTAANNPQTLWEFPAPNRPFSFVFSNFSAAAGQVSATIWACGD